MLTLVGKDRPGIVAEVSQVLFEAGGNLGEAKNEVGDDVTYQMEGYEARAVQHEIDPLEGKLFIDSLVGKRNALKKRTDF